MIRRIAEGTARGEYERDELSGDYAPKGFSWPKLGTDYPPLIGC